MNSLYTSIVQKDSLLGVERALHEHTAIKQEQIYYILEGLQLAMECKNFWYDHKYYVQTKGVVMGVRYAPSIGNLLMNMWEEEYVYAKRIPQLKLCQRYIDDLIILWSGTAETFEQFLKDLNTKRYGITFTGKWSHQQIDYLDLEIFKKGKPMYQNFLQSNRQERLYTHF